MDPGDRRGDGGWVQADQQRLSGRGVAAVAQSVLGPGPDRVIHGGFAEHSRVFAPPSPPVPIRRAVVVLPDPIIPSTRITRAAPTTPGYAAARSLRSLVKDEVRTDFVRADDFARARSSKG